MLAAFLRNQQHALLRFAQHDFVSVMPVSRWGTRSSSISIPTAPATHLAGRAGKACRAHILNAHDGAGFHRFEASFE